MSKEKSTPAPLETTPGQQKDDNIDDLGRKPGNTSQDQPTGDRDSEKTKRPQTDKH